MGLDKETQSSDSRKHTKCCTKVQERELMLSLFLLLLIELIHIIMETVEIIITVMLMICSYLFGKIRAYDHAIKQLRDE